MRIHPKQRAKAGYNENNAMLGHYRDLLFSDNAILQKNGFYGLEKVDEVFNKRHQIVHRGTLPVEDFDYVAGSVSLFLEIERLLTQKAIAKYHCSLKSPSCAVLLDLAKNTEQGVIDIGALLVRALRNV